MGLENYNKKRDFKKTPEPIGIISKSKHYRFVVQRHQASHLHYDLRLEIDGVLKSWAVPKGPSMNPQDKRLAVQTEDHPIDYLFFEGTIPKGNYGAGTMSIWDTGTFASKTNVLEDYENGKLTLSFSGSKLKGLFALVQTKYQEKTNQWLFIKKTDKYATDTMYDAEIYKNGIHQNTSFSEDSKNLSLLNSTIKPMLAAPGTEVFNDADWLYELKYDGYRAIAQLNMGKVTLQSRNGIHLNEKFSPIVKELETIEHDAVLDGEIVYVNSSGIPMFQELTNYPENESKGILQFMVFDLLFLNGHQTIDLPLKDRKSLLKSLVLHTNQVIYSDHIEGMGTTLYERAVTLGMEGIIAKKASSTYDVGYRSENWLKFKRHSDRDAIICGYTITDKNNRSFGSLILGMMEGDKLVYVGNCGSGFSELMIHRLKAKFEPLVTKKCPFIRNPNLKGRKAVWMQPLLICEVQFAEWTKDNRMRHPVFKGLREDKDIPDNLPGKKENLPNKQVVDNFSEYTVDEKSLIIDGIAVSVSNIEKLYWPDSGLLKYDLLDYYIKIGNWMLPHLIDRPQNLHRHPNGIQDVGFYQKDHEHLPPWVQTKRLFSKSTGKSIDYLLCQNHATLIFMANLGCIEINPWHSTIDILDYPNYTIIDLDPSSHNSFKEVLETALVAKDLLDQANIFSICKTSGSSGLHIYIPLGGKYSYKESLNFTKLMCVLIQEKLPKLTTLERSIKKRGPKIYLDYLQNRRGQTIVAPYSARPKPGATVSTPVSWSEIKKGFEMEDFHIKNVPQRLQKKGDLFKDLLTTAIDMEQVLENLNES